MNHITLKLDYFFGSLLFIDGMHLSSFPLANFAERVGVNVVECACVIELPELKVRLSTFYTYLQRSTFRTSLLATHNQRYSL